MIMEVVPFVPTTTIPPRLTLTAPTTEENSLLTNASLASTKTLNILPWANILKTDSQIDQLKSSEKPLEDKLKLREIELDRIVGIVDVAKSKKEKTKKEVAKLKLKLMELQSIMATEDWIIKDLKIDCAVNYIEGYEDFKDRLMRNFLIQTLTLLCLIYLKKIAKDDRERQVAGIELCTSDPDSSTVPTVPKRTE
ncbi:unnamed protein product [Ilex paraguariensis]|uniref:Uncharacterized protein n=1 Tax=Ilex paraguariensis TaxID=185542 RepID=A0ABC8SVE6_9AQUA